MDYSKVHVEQEYRLSQSPLQIHNTLYHLVFVTYDCRGHRGRDRMVVGFTTTYAISAYHH